MAQASAARRVKLIIGLIAGRDAWLDRAAELVADRWGPVEVVSDTWDFDWTDYYRPEMGEGLRRRFLAMGPLVDPSVLPDVKCRTNELEVELAALAPAIPRPVNIDPGYVTEANLVLASMKPFSHRICLRDGVYAEVTLLYHRTGWEALPWTFPDFASGRYAPFFDQARESLRAERSKESPCT